MSHSFQVTFDATDPDGLASFWAIALGYIPQPPPEGFATWDAFAIEAGIPEEEWGNLRALVDPDGTGPRLLFQKVPEGKTAKNRVHLDVNADAGHHVERAARVDAVERHVAQLLDAGASFLERFDREHEYWVVMQDPEGNEFCVQ